MDEHVIQYNSVAYSCEQWSSMARMKKQYLALDTNTNNTFWYKKILVSNNNEG